MSLPKDFVAASAVPLILSILNQQDSYGYAILQQVRELSGGEMQWAEGMLYPVLHRLEKRGLIEAYWGEADTGRKRKYYRLCDEGREQLQELKRNWQRVNTILNGFEKGERNV